MNLPIYIDLSPQIPITINIDAPSVVANFNWGVTNFTGQSNETIINTGSIFIANTTLVFINGVFQGLGIDYTEGSNLQSIVLNVALPIGWEVEIRYVKPN